MKTQMAFMKTETQEQIIRFCILETLLSALFDFHWQRPLNYKRTPFGGGQS